MQRNKCLFLERIILILIYIYIMYIRFKFKNYSMVYKSNKEILHGFSRLRSTR